MVLVQLTLPDKICTGSTSGEPIHKDKFQNFKLCFQSSKELCTMVTGKPKKVPLLFRMPLISLRLNNQSQRSNGTNILNTPAKTTSKFKDQLAKQAITLEELLQTREFQSTEVGNATGPRILLTHQQPSTTQRALLDNWSLMMVFQTEVTEKTSTQLQTQSWALPLALMLNTSTWFAKTLLEATLQTELSQAQVQLQPQLQSHLQPQLQSQPQHHQMTLQTHVV